MAEARDGTSASEIETIRRNVLAVRNSASSLVQMDLNELSTLLPPGTSRERLLEIRSKLVQLHRLQNGVARPSGKENASPPTDFPLTRSSRYKTELCRPYEENGVCKYGSRCQFAHGIHEIRNMSRHPKYKSQLCRTFHSNGLCPYGHRCHFIHNQDEAQNQPSGDASSAPSPNGGIPIPNNGRRNGMSPEFAYSEWGRRASFSNFSNETFQRPSSSNSMQSFMSGPPPVHAFQPMSNGYSADNMLLTNGFKPVSGGSRLGSAGELSPPVSPIVYSPEDPFLSQPSLRHGYSTPAVSAASSDSNLSQTVPPTRFSGPLVGSCPEASVRFRRQQWGIPGISQGLSLSQTVPSAPWSNGDRY